MKKVLVCVLAVVLVLSLAGCGQSKETLAQIDELNKQISDCKEVISQRDNTIADYEQDLVELKKQVNELSKKVDEAKPWFELSQKERDEKEKAILAEKLAAEQAEKEKKENEEKIGYNTGITYDQLARTPDEYVGKKVKFKGRAIQVTEDTGETSLRLAVGGSYDSVLMAYYASSMVNSRVLVDDYITIYGVSHGLYTYESIGNGMITVPLIEVDKIDQ